MPSRSPVALAVVVVLCAFACGSGQIQRQRKDLSKVVPAELDAGTRWEGDVRTARVRVWADVDYRGQSARWRKRITDEVDYANQLLIPMLGVRLELELRTWDHHQAGESLRDVLAALAAHDPGDDVHFVLGLTSALSIVSTSQHELGMAELLGKHIVLRGFSDLEERKAFERRYPDLEEEREEVLDARRRHKQTVILLHEIGHSLGAIHETDPAWIMHPSYFAEQAQISKRNRELMLIALEARLTPGDDATTLAMHERLLGAIEESEWGGWIAAERDEMVTSLRMAIDAAKAGSAAPPVPAAAYDQYERAQRLLAQKQLREAWAEIEPLIAAYPGNASVRLVACQVRLAELGPDHADTKSACNRAIELAPGDPTPHVVLAGALFARGDRAATRRHLADAAGRVGNLPQGQPQMWLSIAAGYQALGDVTRAEEAVARAGVADHPIATWAAHTRTRYGLPRDGARFHITADAEADYVAAVRGILDLVYANRLADADGKARTAERTWPGAPGVATARCDLAFRRGQFAQAQRHCRAAIAAFDGSAWAHYLLGILILRGPDTRAAIASLRRAIEVDPELGQAWRALGKTYQRARDEAALAELRKEYQRRFGVPLP